MRLAARLVTSRDARLPGGSLLSAWVAGQQPSASASRWAGAHTSNANANSNANSGRDMSWEALPTDRSLHGLSTPEASRAAAAPYSPYLEVLGSGSDYTPFLQFIGRCVSEL